jgi:DeoR family glycerol-3-phosphate regulon repressor
MQSLSGRQAEILALARAQGRLGVDELATRFAVTPQTIRKDLNDLCEQRLLTRVHGGAIIASGVANVAYEARRLIAAEEKRAIGAAAAALIPNGSSLFITIGTTTEEVARALGGHEDLLVITNNLHIALSLHAHPRMDVVVAGGTVRRGDGAVTGASAAALIGQYKADVAVIGISAIDPDGTLLDFDHAEVQVSQAMIAAARRVILVADHLKLARTAPVRVAPLSQVQVFVTDRLPSPALRTLCAAAGVEVIETMPAAAVEPAGPGPGHAA